jgi:hypothetical protein
MRFRRLTSLGLLAAVAATTAACYVVPAPYPARVYAPPPPPPVVYAPPPPPACRWVWVYRHWECR